MNRTHITKRTVLLLALFLIAGLNSLFAASPDCHNPNVVTPDGRPTYIFDYLSANTSYYWGFYGQAGHSYSIEMVYDFDNDARSGAPGNYYPRVYNVGDDFCSNISSLHYSFTGPWAPVLNWRWSLRYGFIAPSNGLYGFTASENSNGGYISFRVVDTTMFNPRWSTYSGFVSTWGISNTSDHDINGTLTIYDSAGNVVGVPHNETFRAGQVRYFFSDPSDLNLPSGMAGSATFAYAGPPGAILADAFMTSATRVFPTKFEPRNAQW